jgi:hypothetical protein
LGEKRIEMINGPHGVVLDGKEILKVAANFYKELFKEGRGGCS